MAYLYSKVLRVTLICLVTANLSAQTIIELDSVLISATTIPASIKEVSKSVSIISAEEINSLPVQSIDELLSMYAGVNVNTRNQFGVQADIGMRGSTFSQVVIMLDGVRLNDPLTAHFNSNIPVSLAEISHIEIIRGASSASFGSDAVGGIIHIKTKVFEGKNEEATYFSGKLAAGSNDFKSTDVGFYYAKKKYSFSGSYKTSAAAGETFINPNFIAGIASDSLYRNFFDIKTYSLALSYAITPGLKFYSRVAYDNRNFKTKYFYTHSVYDESEETIKGKWWQNALVYTKNKHNLRLNVAYRTTDDLFIFNPFFASNSHTSQQFILKISDNYKINERLKIAFGGQILNKKVISSDRGNHQNMNSSIFASTSYYLSGNFKTDVSCRIEHDENFGVEVIPQLGIAYVQGKYKLHSSVGRSIRAGDFTERYISALIPNLSLGRNAGNPDLKAETAWSADVGIDYTPNKSDGASASVFYRNSTNLIDFVLTNANDIVNLSNLQEGGDYFYATNVANNAIWGVEFSAFKKMIFSKAISLTGQVNYTYLSTQNKTGVLSKYISNHPNHQANVLLRLSVFNIDMSLSSRFLARNEEVLETIDAKIHRTYVISNVKLAYRFSKSNLKLFGQIQNVFDTEYQEILGAKLPSRWFSAGIQWRFDKK